MKLKKCRDAKKKNVAWPALIILFFYVRPTAGWSPGPEKAAALREEIERLNCRQHFITAKPARQENAVPQVSNDDNKMSSLQLKKSAYFNTGWCLCRSVRLFSTPYPSLLLRVSTLSTLHMLYWMLLYLTMTLLKKKLKITKLASELKLFCLHLLRDQHLLELSLTSILLRLVRCHFWYNGREFCRIIAKAHSNASSAQAHSTAPVSAATPAPSAPCATSTTAAAAARPWWWGAVVTPVPRPPLALAVRAADAATATTRARTTSSVIRKTADRHWKNRF